MELIDVLDENGNKTGEIKPKDLIHKDGNWHAAVHVWFINSNRDILLQLRSLKKDNNPGKWDISVAGHVSSGENSTTTALRETEEEIGLKLKPEDYILIGTVTQSAIKKGGDYINNEYNDIYLVEKDLDISSLYLQPDEVDEIKYIPFNTFKNLVDNNEPSLVSHPDEFKLLFEYLAKK